MQPYALYGLLPHYSLGLEIVVAYAKALNSSTLTSSLLWVAKAAMRTLMAHLFHSYVLIPAGAKLSKSAPHERILVGKCSDDVFRGLPRCAHKWRELSAASPRPLRVARRASLG